MTSKSWKSRLAPMRDWLLSALGCTSGWRSCAMRIYRYVTSGKSEWLNSGWTWFAEKLRMSSAREIAKNAMIVLGLVVVLVAAFMQSGCAYARECGERFCERVT